MSQKGSQTRVIEVHLVCLKIKPVLYFSFIINYLDISSQCMIFRFIFQSMSLNAKSRILSMLCKLLINIYCFHSDFQRHFTHERQPADIWKPDRIHTALSVLSERFYERHFMDSTGLELI